MSRAEVKGRGKKRDDGPSSARDRSGAAARAGARGKIILFGEHAVVHGEPALGMPLSLRVDVALRPGRGEVRLAFGPGISLPDSVSPKAASPWDLISSALGALLSEVDVDIELGVPPMAGLGSSAALAVALLRARSIYLRERPLSARALLDRAIEVENVAHGTSSGVDPAIALSDGLIVYDRASKRISPVTLGAPIFAVIGTRGGHGGTRTSVGGVAEMKATSPKLMRAAIAALGECTRTGTRALEDGDLAIAGRAMDLAHGILSGFGLVSGEIDALVKAAREQGALGAKMSGAGGRGGAFVALAPDRRRAKKIAAELEKRGANVWIERAI